MIEFRGIRKDNGNWINGYYYVWLSISNIFNSKTGISYKIIPETVGQLYPIPDSKENKIYEGDIVEYDNSNYGYGDPNQPERITMVVPSINDIIIDKTDYYPEYLLSIIKNGIKIGSIHDEYLRRKNE